MVKKSSSQPHAIAVVRGLGGAEWIFDELKDNDEFSPDFFGPAVVLREMTEPIPELEKYIPKQD